MGPQWKTMVSYLDVDQYPIYEDPDDADATKTKAANERFMQTRVDNLMDFQFTRSFSLEIVWLILGFGSGFKRVISLWRHCSQPPGDEQQNCWKSTLAMGFGQITAIVQLLVLLATFLDSYGKYLTTTTPKVTQ